MRYLLGTNACIAIAGQARARGLVSVTANVREFARVDGLECEDWSGSAASDIASTRHR